MQSLPWLSQASQVGKGNVKQYGGILHVRVMTIPLKRPLKKFPSGSMHDILKVVPHKVLDNGYIQVPEGFNPIVDEHE